MLDCRVEIESDFSVFHRVDDPMSLPSSRFFEFAELLPAYNGATAISLRALIQRQEVAGPPVPVVRPGEQLLPTVDDVDVLEELTHKHGPGFPAIRVKRG